MIFFLFSRHPRVSDRRRINVGCCFTHNTGPIIKPSLGVRNGVQSNTSVTPRNFLVRPRGVWLVCCQSTPAKRQMCHLHCFCTRSQPSVWESPDGRCVAVGADFTHWNVPCLEIVSVSSGRGRVESNRYVTYLFMLVAHLILQMVPRILPDLSTFSPELHIKIPSNRRSKKVVEIST